MNQLYLNVLLRGRDTLNEEEQANIETLAFTCPYIGGNAVYRARVLHSMRHWGIHYDDLVICNGQGVYKNGISKLQEQLNQLANYSNAGNQATQRQIADDEVILYPNPTHDIVNILCTNAKRIIVYDLIGGCRLNKVLNYKTDVNSIETNSLPIGIYFYKVIKINGETFTGKLLIE